MSSYQFLPNLTLEEVEALRNSIRSIGIQIPVETDEAGTILDGHHRAAIAEELGIDCPKVIREGLTEAEKLQRVIDLNMARRHLTREQQRDVIRDLRGRGISYRAIGKAVSVDAATAKRTVDAGVAFATPEVESTKTRPDPPPTVVGRDGKTYPARRSPKMLAKAPERPVVARPTGAGLIRAELTKLLGIYRPTLLRKTPPGAVAMAIAPGSVVRRAAGLRALADHLGAVADALEARTTKGR